MKSKRTQLLLAGSLVAFAAAMVIAEKAGYIGGELSERATQVAVGLVLVYFANLAPKTLEPLSSGCNPARAQAFQRFSGRALVMGGLGYSLAWLVAPFERAAVVAMAILGTAVLLVVARYVRLIRTRPSRGGPSEPRSAAAD